MSDPNPTRTAPASPPLSATAGARPQETLLQRGAFDSPVTPGTLGRLDRFEILRLIGEGGMGQVYLAREPRTDAQVAIKIMKPRMADDPQTVHRFLTEARHMYRLSHPRILRVLEVSDRAEGPYYVMPYVPGGSLQGECRPEEPVATERALAIARQVAEALAHAHGHGLIHRDLKPGNVLLDNEGNAFLTDFGLVRTVFNDSMVDPSASHLEGTAPYISPAVARGEAEDTRCDIYAFGTLLYEMLTGRPPYTGRTPQMILDQVLKGPPKPIREANPKADAVLTRIAEGCMARELRDRYATMADVVADLDRAAQGKAPYGPHGVQRPRLSRLAVSAAGAVAVTGLVWVAVKLAPFHVPSPKPPAELPPEPATPVRWEGPFGYTVADGKATIVKYNGLGGEVVIPSEIKGLPVGLPVTAIGGFAFAHNKGLSQVAVPASVRTIGGNAFSDCANLRAICFDGDAPRPYSTIFGASSNATIYYRPGTKGWGPTFDGRPTAVRPDGELPPETLPALDLTGARTEGPFSYTVADGKATIVKYNGSGGTAAVPDKIMGLPVTGIGPGAFSNQTLLKSVVIPAGVTNIGDWAFYYCTGLTNVTIPKGVSRIGNGAFRQCPGLIQIVLPDGLITVGEGAFWGARLRHIEYPATLRHIGTGAHIGSILESIYFHGDAPELAPDAFRDTVNATIYYRRGTKGWGPSFGARPTKVWEEVKDASALALATPGILWEGPFAYIITNNGASVRGYTGTTDVVDIPEKMGGWSVRCIPRDLFIGLPDVRHVIIRADVGYIEHAQFRGCAKLNSVTVPRKVWALDREAFADCTNLTGVYFHGDAPTSVRTGIFRGSTNVIIYYRPGTKGWGPTFADRPTRVWEAESQSKAQVVTPFMWATNDNAITITKYTGPGGKVEVPERIHGLPVTVIGDHAFSTSALSAIELPATVTRINDGAFAECARLTGITIPAGVTSIGWTAFTGAAALKSIDVAAGNTAYCSEGGVLFNKEKTALLRYPPGRAGDYAVPKGVTRIDRGAFAGCGGLTAVSIPEGVCEIGLSAFHSCGRLTAVALPGTITRIGDSAFNRCGSLTDVRLAEGVTHVGQYAFAYCNQLNAVSLPSSVVSLDPGAFLSCTKLKAIRVLPGNTVYASDAAGAVFDMAKTVLISYPSGRPGHYTIPDGVVTIREGAFAYAGNLTGIIFPPSLERVEHAFATDALTAVCFSGEPPQLARPDLFSASRYATIYYPPNAKGWSKTFGGRPTATGEVKGSFLVADNRGAVTVIRYLGQGGEVEIPAMVEGVPVGTVGRSAFKDSTGVTSLMVPGSVLYVDSSAFAGCTGLTNLVLRVGVSRIDDGAFFGCSGLKSVTLPASLTDLRPSAFQACSALEAVHVDGRNPTYKSVDGVLFNKEKAELIVYPGARRGGYHVPDGTVTIGWGAFSGSTNVTSVTTPEGVRSIDCYAFDQCKGLTNAIFAASVTNIAANAFSGCVNMQAMHFMGDAPQVAAGAFASHSKSTIYFRPGTKGWGPEFGGRPTKLWAAN